MPKETHQYNNSDEEFEIGDEVLKRIAQAKRAAEEEEDEEVSKVKTDKRSQTSKLNAQKARKTKLAKLKASKLAAEIDDLESEYERDPPKGKGNSLEMAEMKAEIMELKKMLIVKQKEEKKPEPKKEEPKPQSGGNDVSEFIKRKLINF